MKSISLAIVLLIHQVKVTSSKEVFSDNFLRALLLNEEQNKVKKISSRNNINERNLKDKNSGDGIEFKEIITFKMSHVPSLLSMEDQTMLSNTLQTLIQKKSDNHYTNVKVGIIRQMIERKRHEDDYLDDILLVVSITGKAAITAHDQTFATNTHEYMEYLLQDNKVKFARDLSKLDSYFSNVTKVRTIETPKAFLQQNARDKDVLSQQQQNQQKQEQSYDTYNKKNSNPSILVMETDNDEKATMSDITSIIGVCVLTAGLIALITIASVFLRRSLKSDALAKAAALSSSSSAKKKLSVNNSSQLQHSKQVNKQKKQTKSSSNNNKVMKHPWKTSNNDTEQSRIFDEITFMYPNDEIDMPTPSSTKHISDDTSSIAEAGSIEEEQQQEIRGEFFAPPGKLGVAVDTINGVPVVHRVKPGSPLQGILQHMDRIIAIDEVDTSRMTAGDVTKLMVQRMSRPRKITYLRGGSHGAAATTGSTSNSSRGSSSTTSRSDLISNISM